jgi:hypothetical protein
MVRAVDTGVVNVSDLDKEAPSAIVLLTIENTQLSLAVQESADKLRTLANLEPASTSEQVAAQEILGKP